MFSPGKLTTLELPFACSLGLIGRTRHTTLIRHCSPVDMAALSKQYQLEFGQLESIRFRFGERERILLRPRQARYKPFQLSEILQQPPVVVGLLLVLLQLAKYTPTRAL